MWVSHLLAATLFLGVRDLEETIHFAIPQLFYSLLHLKLTRLDFCNCGPLSIPAQSFCKFLERHSLKP